MSVSIDLYFYDEKQLKANLIAWGATDEMLLIKVMGKFGKFIGSKYVLLNNEYGDGYSPYYNLAGVIDKVFGKPDSFNVIIESDREEGVSFIDEQEVLNELFPGDDFDDE